MSENRVSEAGEAKETREAAELRTTGAAVPGTEGTETAKESRPRTRKTRAPREDGEARKTPVRTGRRGRPAAAHAEELKEGQADMAQDAREGRARAERQHEPGKTGRRRTAKPAGEAAQEDAKEPKTRRTRRMAEAKPEGQEGRAHESGRTRESKPRTAARTRRTAPKIKETPVEVILEEKKAALEAAEAAPKGRRRTRQSAKGELSVFRTEPGASIKIIPLGGLDQIGMNITAIEYEDNIIVIDCGLSFPSDDMLGIDLVIPDVSYLKNNLSKVKGFVITHGHEDHIGALPYILREVNVPVYGTRLTLALIENKLKEHGLENSVQLNVMKFGGTADLGAFRVEFIKTNHSISDASALAIFTPAGVLMHTGDFKVDYTPVFGDAIDLQRFAELGKQGVLALMSDSTNAIKPGFTMSERTVGRTFDAIFAEHKNNRIIVATFASNVDRVQQIINTASKYDRKVVVEGRSMVNVISVASELGYIRIPEGTLIDIENLKNYPDEKTVLITTGSQGESMAALSRMASGMHRKVSIKPTDVVILSSTPIPGNEKAVAKVINELSQKHAEVIFQDTHVSGHACSEELKLIYSLIHPRYAIPVHGEYRHRKAAAELAQSVGIPKDRCLMLENGDVLQLSEEKAEIVDHVQAGGIFVDGLGVGDVGNIVLRDRQNLAQNGIIVVVLTLERYSGHLLAGPDLVSRGFVYVRESEDLLDEARTHVQNAVDDCLVRHVNDWGKIKNIIKDSLSDFLWRRIKRNPVILPIIMEV